MSKAPTRYCLDANVLIQAWQKYYSPRLCPSYWDNLNLLGQRGVIFIPKVVYDEIIKTEDDLSKWLANSDIPILQIDGEVTRCLSTMYATNELHKYLVDNKKNRSLADPWIVAHAMKEQAVVVTKEERLLVPSVKTIRIPNVCDNMGLRCINDFQFIGEIGMRFESRFMPPSTVGHT